MPESLWNLYWIGCWLVQIKSQAEKIDLEPASQEGGLGVGSLAPLSLYQYFGRSKAVCSQARGQKESLWFLCQLLQLSNSIWGLGGGGKAGSPSGFSPVLQLGHMGLLPQAHGSLPTLMLIDPQHLTISPRNVIVREKHCK